MQTRLLRRPALQGFAETDESAGMNQADAISWRQNLVHQMCANSAELSHTQPHMDEEPVSKAITGTYSRVLSRTHPNSPRKSAKPLFVGSIPSPSNRESRAYSRERVGGIFARRSVRRPPATSRADPLGARPASLFHSASARGRRRSREPSRLTPPTQASAPRK